MSGNEKSDRNYVVMKNPTEILRGNEIRPKSLWVVMKNPTEITWQWNPTEIFMSGNEFPAKIFTSYQNPADYSKMNKHI